MAAYSYVIGGDHDFSDPSRSVLEQERTSTGVTIGAGVWLGAGAKVLGNIEIGSCSRVAAGSVVVHPVPPRVTVAGVPARIVGEAGCPEPSRTMDQMLSDFGG